MTLDLPFPPSLNSIWRSRRGHKTGKPAFYLDGAYKAWKREADALAMAQKPLPRVPGAFAATVVLSAGKRRSNTDADNRVKVVLDWLQRAGCIDNDSKAERITVQWGEAPEGCRVTLEAA